MDECPEVEEEANTRCIINFTTLHSCLNEDKTTNCGEISRAMGGHGNREWESITHQLIQLGNPLNRHVELSIFEMMYYGKCVVFTGQRR